MFSPDSHQQENCFQRAASSRRPSPTSKGLPAPPRYSEISIPQVQPVAPARKLSDGAPSLVQADNFFYCDSHAFNNPEMRGTSYRALSAQLFAKRNGKNARGFAASSPLRCRPALLSLGSVVEESTMQLSPFLTDNLS